MDWQSRFTSDKIQHMAASQFLAHPNNPRRHPADQRAAVKGSLDTLGWVAPVIINSRTGYVVDGHERIMQALGKGDNTPVPYLQIDLSEAEEAQFLATFDWTTQMAYYDADVMSQLAQLVSRENGEIAELMLSIETDLLILTGSPTRSSHETTHERDFWPIIRAKVSPEAHAQFLEMCESVTDGADTDHLMHVIALAWSAYTGVPMHEQTAEDEDA